ncbi:MAG TPA: aldehyde dehydrogenase [Jatrophihabitantaceae bacterium]|nr:aldehyde dehydrogenase [Jatrophihabitantaceae bacterium]
MALRTSAQVPLHSPGQFFIGGEWRTPSTPATFDVLDSVTEEVYYRVAEAREEDMERAIAAARVAFDQGPWPRMTHAGRASYLRAFAAELESRSSAMAEIWPRESGVLAKLAGPISIRVAGTFTFYADLADKFAFEEPIQPTSGGEFGLLVREPVGVVGAIIPWNAPLSLAVYKIAPALLAGCTIVLKASPEAPGAAYVLAEVAEKVGLPAGVLNVLTADREVSELLVRDARIDKIAFTGSTAVGRRIASLCGERIARYTLELGGKSAAVILDDAELETAAGTLARAECFLAGQVCASVTRLIVTRKRHDEFVENLAGVFSKVRVGSPFERATQMGPLATARQRDQVMAKIARGIEEGATLVTGGRRPEHLERGYFVEPTVFANVANSSTIGREEVFGPVLCVIPVDNEEQAIAVANDSIYGLNASVFTEDVDRARWVAGRLRSGTVGHNNVRVDFGMAFGGFKQSGVGREGGIEGLLPYLETKTVILEGRPSVA